MMHLTSADLKRMFPRGQKDWLDALRDFGPELAAGADITTPLRWRHFVAQITAETSALALPRMRENMNYRAKRILEVFDYRVRKAQRDNPRFRGKSLTEIAGQLAGNPDLLAETVYGGRKELGNRNPGDGARYIGRSPLQTTGREWYARIGAEIGVDLLAEPQLLETPEVGWRGAFAEWRLLKANALADMDSVERVSRKVNGGTNGLAHRKQAYAKAATIWPDTSVVAEADETPITPRHADAPVVGVTAKEVADAGSRSMTWLERLKRWLFGGGLGFGGFLTADSLGAFRSTTHELKLLVADHALVAILVGVAAILGIVVLAQHFLVEAARDGRYDPRKA